MLVHILLPAEQTEAVMDRLEDRYDGLDGFRIVLFPVDAVLPREGPGPQVAQASQAGPAESGPCRAH